MDDSTNNEVALVYLAAGNSSRFNRKPKVLARIGQKPFIEYSLEQTLKAGFTKIFFIVSEETHKLFLERFGTSYKGVPIFYSIQSYNPSERDKPWGTVDALCTLNGKVDCPFVLCNGDDLYGEETFRILKTHLIEQNKGNRESATVWYKMDSVLPLQGQVNRGVFEDNLGYVLNIKETHSISRQNLEEIGLSLEDKCGMGIFALFPETLGFLHENLLKFKEQNKRDRTKECLTGIELSDLIKKGRMKMRLYPTNSYWVGITNPDDVDSVKKYLDIM